MKKLYIWWFLPCLLWSLFLFFSYTVYAGEVLTYEELGDNLLSRSIANHVNDSVELRAGRASAYYLKAILEEEKKQTKLLQELYYK